MSINLVKGANDLLNGTFVRFILPTRLKTRSGVYKTFIHYNCTIITDENLCLIHFIYEGIFHVTNHFIKKMYNLELE